MFFGKPGPSGPIARRTIRPAAIESTPPAVSANQEDHRARLPLSAADSDAIPVGRLSPCAAEATT